MGGAPDQSSSHENCPPTNMLKQVESKYATNNVVHVRERCNVTYDMSAFTIPSERFDNQYAPLYVQRINELRPVLQEKLKNESLKICPKIIDLSDGDTCIIIGTLFKEMPQKPCILDEITEESTVKDLKVEKYVSDDDKLILEDESDRVVLKGPGIPVNHLVTGVVLAVAGRMENSTGFLVDSWYTCGLPPQVPRPIISEDRYVALVSGIGLGRNDSSFPKLQLLVDYLSGRMGDEHLVSKISHVIVAGNSVVSLSTEEDTDYQSSSAQKQDQLLARATSIQQLDLLLAQLLPTTFVDVMSGPSDPSNFILPQQPMHKCLFPASRRFTSFTPTNNPYQSVIDGVRFLGTAGQTVSSIQQCVSGLSDLECLERSLTWRHMAPTAPDVLGCIPDPKVDPYIISSCPDVYFAGNQSTFSDSFVSEEGTSVRVVCVPEFCKLSTIVLVNLKDLSTMPIELSVEE